MVYARQWVEKGREIWKYSVTGTYLLFMLVYQEAYKRTLQ